MNIKTKTTKGNKDRFMKEMFNETPTAELVQQVVERTLTANWGNAADNNFSSSAKKSQSLPKHKDYPVDCKTNPDLFQIGHYQFSPFSFQDPLEKVKSDTHTLLEFEKKKTFRGSKKVFPFSMMTQEACLSYDNGKPVYKAEQQKSTGGKMVDLSGYKDLTKPPASNGQSATLTKEDEYEMETEYLAMSSTTSITPAPYAAHPETHRDDDLEIYAEYSGNVKTLVQLVNDLPEGVTKQTGAQIIRLTMEAMGISMETVLSDAQSVQSELLDAVRTNIKKIEEYKTVIRKLETEIRYHQGKANELSEIIDLFILSNTSPNMPNIDRHDNI